jgi:hypothetical protein
VSAVAHARPGARGARSARRRRDGCGARQHDGRRQCSSEGKRTPAAEVRHNGPLAWEAAASLTGARVEVVVGELDLDGKLDDEQLGSPASVACARSKRVSRQSAPEKTTAARHDSPTEKR